MRKLLLLSVIVYITTLTTFAQNLSLSDKFGNPISNGDTIKIWGDTSILELETDIDVKNIGSNNIDVKVKKIKISLIQDTYNYFCWVQCQDTAMYNPTETISLQPNQITSDFTTHYGPRNHFGVSILDYVFFDGNDPNDSVRVNVEFHITGVGLQENIFDLIKFSNAYPNPAKSFTTFDYSFPSSVNNVRIEIRDILGSVVREVKLIGGKGVYRLETASMNDGIYFYSVLVNEKLYTTKKFIVNR